MNCNQCQMLSINGVACHETGCPNAKKSYVDGQWLTVFHCTECGSQHTDPENMQLCCTPEAQEQTIRILSIDAWREGAGWHWNNWFKAGTCPLSLCDLKPRALLKALREEYGILSAASAGKVSVEDDGYNIVIKQRSNDMPLCALEYGALNR
jgi:hypothetical protein